MWWVDNPARAFTIGQTQHLDLENLLTLEGPCCFWCEQVWTRTLGSRCRGPVGCTVACSEAHTYGPDCELKPREGEQ